MNCCCRDARNDRGYEFPKLQRMEYADAMRNYGIDKPDLRFGMLVHEVTDLAKNRASSVRACAREREKERERERERDTCMDARRCSYQALPSALECTCL